jgi:hypothetical protein
VGQRMEPCEHLIQYRPERFYTSHMQVSPIPLRTMKNLRETLTVFIQFMNRRLQGSGADSNGAHENLLTFMLELVC